MPPDARILQILTRCAAVMDGGAHTYLLRRFQAGSRCRGAFPFCRKQGGAVCITMSMSPQELTAGTSNPQLVLA